MTHPFPLKHVQQRNKRIRAVKESEIQVVQLTTVACLVHVILDLWNFHFVLLN